MRAEWSEVCALQRSLPDDALQIVARRARKDGKGVSSRISTSPGPPLPGEQFGASEATFHASKQKEKCRRVIGLEEVFCSFSDFI